MRNSVTINSFYLSPRGGGFANGSKGGGKGTRVQRAYGDLKKKRGAKDT